MRGTQVVRVARPRRRIDAAHSSAGQARGDERVESARGILNKLPPRSTRHLSQGGNLPQSLEAHRPLRTVAAESILARDCNKLPCPRRFSCTRTCRSLRPCPLSPVSTLGLSLGNSPSKEHVKNLKHWHSPRLRGVWADPTGGSDAGA